MDRSFVLTVLLPPGVDIDHAEARVSRGVLTVRFSTGWNGSWPARSPRSCSTTRTT